LDRKLLLRFTVLKSKKAVVLGQSTPKHISDISVFRWKKKRNKNSEQVSKNFTDVSNTGYSKFRAKKQLRYGYPFKKNKQTNAHLPYLFKPD
jgi:heterodisulfide reductase subunit A-like polyferredoxin